MLKRQNELVADVYNDFVRHAAYVETSWTIAEAGEWAARYRARYGLSLPIIGFYNDVLKVREEVAKELEKTCMDCGKPGGRICYDCEQEWLDK